MRRAAITLALAALAGLASACDGVQSSAGRLRDSLGRELLFRGVNARVEGVFDVRFDDGRRPVETVPAFGEADCTLLSEELGMNLLRLAISWSGVEPQRGQYDEAYIDRVIAVVDACARHDVFTIVDFHQDAWSKEIGQDGAPLWAIVPPPTQLLEGPIANLDARRFSAQALNAAASFFQNAQGLQDAFGDMAAHVAARLAGHPGAIMLELMNEPLLLPGQLPDIYGAIDAFQRKAGAAVRAARPDLTLLVAPNSVRNVFDAVPVVQGFPLGDIAYAPHVYTGVFSQNAGTLANLRTSTQNAAQEAARVGGALLVGEWGNDPRTPAGRQYMQDAMRAFDEARASWAFWVYEEVPPAVWGLWDTAADLSSRTLRPDAADTLARPFPQIVDGTIDGIDYDPALRVLRTTITPGGHATGHRFALPRRTWPAGVRATCDGAPTWTSEGAGFLWVGCEGREIVLAPAR